MATAWRTVRGYAHEAGRRARLMAAGVTGPRPRGAPGPATVVCVYRDRHVPRVRRLLRGVPDGWDVRLWALEHEHPALAPWTVGAGRGGRFGLLDGLLAERPVPPDQHVVVADDDVVLSGSLAELVATVERARLDISQPAHLRCSRYSHSITRRRAMVRARLTTYVEIGPVLVVSPAWRHEVVPFGEHDGLGWGAEIAWRRLAERGCRLGIVDAVPVLHPEPPGAGYDAGAELGRLADRLAAAGVDPSDPRAAMDSLQHEVARWATWRRTAPWVPT